ncbi:MAG: hypothetical protein VB065_02875, partial [Eubacteriales bacterium]|nr:hypothetical protein [Eubacteriales bacterium]
MPNTKQAARWRHASKMALQIMIDVVIVNVSFLAALYLRYEKAVPGSVLQRYVNIWPVLTLFCIAAFCVTRVYRCLWRYASIGEVLRLLLGTILGIMATYAFAVVATALERTGTRLSFFQYMLGLVGNSVRIQANSFLHGKVVYGVAWLIMFLLIAGQRFSIRLINQLGVKRRAISPEQRRRVLVVGAGWGGATVIREMAARGYREGMPVVVVDDDPAKARTLLSGVPIAPSTERIPDYVKK